MIDSLYISATGLRAEQKQIDVISNNVANMQTPGYKKNQVHFSDVAIGPAPGAAVSGSPVAAGNGVRAQSTSTVFSQGEMRPTGNSFDIAVDGSGFFELQALDGGLVYTRDGQFRLNAEGYLMTIDGLMLSQSFPVPQGSSEFRVSADGDVSVVLAGEVERTVIGQIELATFPSADALRSIGNNKFVAVDDGIAAAYGRPGDAGFGRLQQGVVELANVEMIDEMSALVMAQRAYQLNARVLQASDQVLETINNLRR